MNVIDSAINYRFQRSERSVGAALAELARRGYAREELVICTKGGFLTPDGDMPADASEYFNREYVETGILREGDVAAGCHSMAPKFIADQLERSRRNLGVETIDVYYLHNPETQLGEVPREMFNTPPARRVCVSRIRRGRGENSFLRAGHLERVSPDRDRPGFSFARRDGIACAGRCRGIAPFPFRAIAVQPGDDRGIDARQSADRWRAPAGGRSRVQAGHHAGGQRGDAPGTTLARTCRRS